MGEGVVGVLRFWGFCNIAELMEKGRENKNKLVVGKSE